MNLQLQNRFRAYRSGHLKYFGKKRSTIKIDNAKKFAEIFITHK